MEQNLWGSRLKGLSWRVDVKTKARDIEQLNQPTAIMEMQLDRGTLMVSAVKIKLKKDLSQ